MTLNLKIYVLVSQKQKQKLLINLKSPLLNNSKNNHWYVFVCKLGYIKLQ